MREYLAAVQQFKFMAQTDWRRKRGRLQRDVFKGGRLNGPGVSEGNDRFEDQT